MSAKKLAWKIYQYVSLLDQYGDDQVMSTDRITDEVKETIEQLIEAIDERWPIDIPFKRDG